MKAKTENAAVILCAGKGTRMGDSPINKVCFDCAGAPVIRRVVQNMRAGGVGRFVIVVGHRAESVMGALDGEDGILYAFQKEQKGTGHAALCGLKVLRDIGFGGNVIVSMGDKIVRSETVAGLLANAKGAKAVWGVQMREANPNGGRVVMDDGGKLAGVVELADAGLMAIKGLPESAWAGKLAELGLNPKKAAKVVDRAKLPGALSSVPDRRFGKDAAQILLSKYANAGLYCFDADSVTEAIGSLGSDNAQGEIYLTDALEWFAKKSQVVPFEVSRAGDMLTYSTRPELREMSRKFMRKASECLADGECAPWRAVLEKFVERFGDRPVVLTSAPGRVNLMGRHIDHRGGSINVMTTSQATYMAISPREDDTVCAVNVDGAFAEGSFSISSELEGADRSDPCAKNWLAFLDSDESRAKLASSRGNWLNYVKSAVLRLQYSADFSLCGMDIAVGGDVPCAAGLSSSSTIVVAVAEAVVALNGLNMSTRTFVDMCCEGEWFVGSRGGAGDHAAMKCSLPGKIIHLGFKPFTIGETFPFSPDYAIVIADSGEKAKKSESAGRIYNSRIEDYEAAIEIIRGRFPEHSFPEFRDIAKLPDGELEKVLAVLKGSVRNIATYGVEECRRAEKCTELLRYGDYEGLGNLMKESHDGDRIGGGKYECSTAKIDAMCDALNAMPGVLGSEIVGAGLGGSFIALVRKEAVAPVLAFLESKGISAISSFPSGGSRVVF